MSEDINSLENISSLLKEGKKISMAKKGSRIELNIESNINEETETNTGIKEENKKYLFQSTAAIIELIKDPKEEILISECSGYNNKLGKSCKYNNKFAENMDNILNNGYEIDLSYSERKRTFITKINEKNGITINQLGYPELWTSFSIIIGITSRKIKQTLKNGRIYEV